MQEVRDEMAKRLAALKRRTEYLETQRVEHQEEIAQLDVEISTNSTLAEQYRQVLDTLAKPA